MLYISEMNTIINYLHYQQDIQQIIMYKECNIVVIYTYFANNQHLIEKLFVFIMCSKDISFVSVCTLSCHRTAKASRITFYEKQTLQHGQDLLPRVPVRPAISELQTSSSLSSRDEALNGMSTTLLTERLFGIEFLNNKLYHTKKRPLK